MFHSRRGFTKTKKEEVRRLFDDVYKKLYAGPIPILRWNHQLQSKGSLPERLIQFPKIGNKGKSLQKAIKGNATPTPIQGNFIPYTVYDRINFSNAKFTGPAIIEEKESTLIIGEDTSVSVDDFGFLWVDILTAPESAPVKTGFRKPRSASVEDFG